MHKSLSSPVVPEKPLLPVNIAGTKESPKPAVLESLNVAGCVPGTDSTLITLCATSGKETKYSVDIFMWYCCLSVKTSTKTSTTTLPSAVLRGNGFKTNSGVGGGTRGEVISV